jgi:(p)ppGpp synthase/HD superfamily hydrolase
MTDLEKAILVATKAHAAIEQREKSGVPYILHPLRVMLQTRTEVEMMAAVLHDVVEDTKLTLEDLRREGLPERVIEAVDCLTNREGEPYDDFIERVKTNPIARNVKLADLKDNMDITRLVQLSGKDVTRLNQYLRAWRELLNT